MKTINTLLCCVIFISIASCAQQQEDASDKLPVEAIAIPATNGWGYEIHVDHKIFIKQDYIPAVSGMHKFINKEQALLTADMVIDKMKEGKKPYITINELQNVGIVLDK